MKWENLKTCIDILDQRGDIDPELTIDNIIHDSRKVKKKGIFVAITGSITDGHDFIPSATEAGAEIAIVERFVDVNIPQIKVKNSRIALAQLANSFYDHPSRKMKIIGITATNGKTTTSFMLAKILQDAGFNVGIIGTVEIKFGNTVIPSDLTTPESIDLQKYLYLMEQDGVEIVVMEISSSAQELFRNYGIDFDIVSFHNISEEHIEQHGSYEKYLMAKSKLIKEAKEKTAVILNPAFPDLEDLIHKTNGQVFTISTKSEDRADLEILNLDITSGKGIFTCRLRTSNKNDWDIEEDRIDISLGVAGYSSVLNSLVSILVAKLLNIENDIIVKSLKTFSGVERRFEMIYDDEFKILDDHFANKKNIEITMSTLEKMDYARLHIVYAIRGNRGKQLNYSNAKDLVDWIKKLKPANVLITKSIDTTGPKDLVSQEEEYSCYRAFNENNIEYNLREDLESSILEIMPKLRKGDVLLLAGCQGMDKGARFVWDYLLEEGPKNKKDEIYKKIDERIC